MLGNALKFTVRGEVYLGVSLVKNESDESIRLGFQIKDTGIGIPVEKMSKLFKAFSQVDSSTTRKYGGSGLGLAICERLVKLMGGSITVESELGKGTTFHFTITAKVNKKAMDSYAPCNLDTQKSKKVLIVDDNATNRKVLSIQLNKWGLDVEVSNSATHALNYLKENKYDLLISDMQMPDMDGVQLAEVVRIKQPLLPIILLSSIGDEARHQYPHLFSAVLNKPVKQQRLCQVILACFQLEEPGKQEQLSSKLLSAKFAEQHPLQILIAEDNLINQKVISTILNKLGYQPTIANTGLQVLSLIHQQPFNVILMDIQMPDMDGLEATRHIRTSKLVQPVILAMTANVMQEDKDECLRAGMDGFISKPISVDNLLISLSKAYKLSS
jgi:CheY-like chemotaxis protein